ncbi:MAG: hypothetical protein V9F00_16885 [Nocardioides sp.]
MLRVDRLRVGPAQAASPTAGTRTYDFDVHTWDTCDAYGRFRVRLDEMWRVAQASSSSAADRLAKLEGAPVMVADKKIAWPSQLAIGTDGHGQQPRPHQGDHGRPRWSP